jgi:hypothetical protein
MSPDVGRCSVASMLRDEPLAGTAPVARRWVLIEHPGPWARLPLDTPPFAGALGARFEEALTRHNASLLLLRRSGRQPEDIDARLWRVVDTQTGDSITGTWLGERDLEGVLTALATINGPFAEPCPPMVLVCTHGVRDACCAIKGRPIAGILGRSLDNEVWECSHLAGHRFAGTALVLPEGACYGRLDQSDAVKVIKAHQAGAIVADRLRGVTRLPAAAQAAHVWGLAELARRDPAAPRSVDSIEIGTVEETADRALCEVHGIDGRDGAARVEVVRTEQPAVPLSCGKPATVAVGHVVSAVGAITP